MKLKSLSVLGLLAAAPMASQAAMVEMNETELSDVSGQAYYNFAHSGSFTIGAKTFSNEQWLSNRAYSWGDDFSVGADIEYDNSVTGAYGGAGVYRDAYKYTDGSKYVWKSLYSYHYKPAP